MNTNEKKAKYNKLAKDLATKLAFKNLKTQIFKHQESIGSGAGSSTAHSSAAYSGNSSEGEQTTSGAAAILTVDEGIVR